MATRCFVRFLRILPTTCRGSFTRIGCRRTGSPSAPNSFGCSARRGISARNTQPSPTPEPRLLGEYRDTWHAELPTIPGVTWSDLFVRGFLDSAWIEPEGDLQAQLDAMF